MRDHETGADMSFSFINVYFQSLGTHGLAPNTCTTCGFNSKCEQPSCSGGSAGCSMIQVERALSKASKTELEELRGLLEFLQRNLEPHIEAADQQTKPVQDWEELKAAE
jgi:hypothetical protein